MDVGTGGAEGAAAPPTFGMGEQAMVLAPPKVGAFCTAMSLIDLDIAAQKAQTDNGSSFAAPWDVQEPKSFQLQGGFAP